MKWEDKRSIEKQETTFPDNQIIWKGTRWLVSDQASEGLSKETATLRGYDQQM